MKTGLHQCRLCEKRIETGDYCTRCVPPPADNSFREGATCQEASALSRMRYLACGQAAEVIVHHAKDRRAYYMCAMCADHNIRNRGGAELARKTV